MAPSLRLSRGPPRSHLTSPPEGGTRERAARSASTPASCGVHTSQETCKTKPTHQSAVTPTARLWVRCKTQPTLHPLVGCARRPAPGLSHERVYTRTPLPGEVSAHTRTRVSVPADSPAQLAPEVAATVATERPPALMAHMHVFLRTQIDPHGAPNRHIAPPDSLRGLLMPRESVRDFGRFPRHPPHAFLERYSPQFAILVFLSISHKRIHQTGAEYTLSG